ncbi:MAG: cardiolipin synthase [Prevotella sp.]|nr:cardiolipin synthase [Prevotella sp.]
MSLQGLLFILYQMVVISAIVHVLMDNRQPAKTMAWALVIYFVPLIGIIAYVFFGVNTRKERMVSRRSMDALTKRSMLGFVEQRNLILPDTQKPLIDLFVNESFSLPFSGSDVQVLTSGYDFFPSLLRDIACATSHIHIDIYIFEDDALGRLIADALMAKSHQGVEVRIVYDDVGCWNVPARFFERLRREGIEVEPFMPVRFPSFARRANYRNHRKIFIIDGRVGYIGGMNIAMRYVKDGWRDTMLRIEGRGVYALQRAFLIDWYFVDTSLLSEAKYYPPSLAKAPHTKDSLLQVVTSSPTAEEAEIMQGYVRIILAARRYVYIETPYFLPTEIVFYALKTASLSGVDVKVMVPMRSDARFTEWASRSFLRRAVEAGVQVLLYKPGFLHSKMLVSDDVVSSCGSTNVDFRSFENNFEANAFVYGNATAQRLRDVFLDDERNCVPLTSMVDLMRPRFLTRLIESFARLFSPLL